MTPIEIEQWIDTAPPSIAETIAEQGEEIRATREGLSMAVAMGIMDIPTATKINKELVVADYYMTAGWTAMIEGDTETAERASKEIDTSFDRILAILETINQPKPKGTAL